MKCPNCGGQMGIEDAVCSYCDTPNTLAVQHQSDMARYRQEYQRTQESVMQKTSFLQRHGSWLVILSVLLVALVVGIVLLVSAWEIGYSIRENDVERDAAEHYRVMDAFLEQGDYGKFSGYYSANGISIMYENPYQGLQMAANAYVDLMQYIAALSDSSSYQFRPERIGDTCGYIADDLNRIYTLEERYYYYDDDRYLPPDKRVYLDDIRERTAVIAKAYFGLTDKDIEDIPNLSTKKLAKMIESGIAPSGGGVAPGGKGAASSGDGAAPSEESAAASEEVVVLSSNGVESSEKGVTS